MTLLLKDGDYVPDSEGKLTSLTGMEEVLQRVLIRLTARRGAFPLMPELGSRLYLLLHESPKNRGALARQYVREALADERDLDVTGVTLTENADGTASLAVQLDWQGEALTAVVGVE